METGAYFSKCEAYRYRLWRIWDASKPLCNFLMLNPSTADHERNDQTITLCVERARRMGYGGLVVTNLFAFRSTYPKVMKAAVDPIGPENDSVIEDVARTSGMVIGAWGNDGTHRARAWQVRRAFARLGIPLHALKLTKTGEPCHPLRLSYDLKPFELGRAS